MGGPEDSPLQDLYDTGQKQDSQESEGQVLIVKQKLEALNQTRYNEHLKVKLYGVQGIMCDRLRHTTAFITRFFFILFCSLWCGEGGFKGRRQMPRDWKMNEIMIMTQYPQRINKKIIK